MINDTTTFFLAFLALFGGIAWYLLRLDRDARALEQRLALLEARADAGRTPPVVGGAPPPGTGARPSADVAANEKNDERETRS